MEHMLGEDPPLRDEGQVDMVTKLRKVLLVDDNEKVLQSLTMVCEILGVGSVASTGAVEALKKCELGDVDLVITDVRMPGMSGIELLLALKDAHSEVPVVLFSANELNRDDRKVVDERADGFLVKPFKIDALRVILDQFQLR